MRFGICTSVDNAPAVRSAGWDFVEENIQGLFQGLQPDEQYTGLPRVQASALPVVAANCLVPGSLKIVGPEVDFAKLQAYMDTVLRRANQAHTRVLVFGSGGARHVPEGFDRQQAQQQIVAFAKMAAELAARYDLTIVLEPLNKKECNIINSVAEAIVYVKAVNHPRFQCLVDSYHFWTDADSLVSLREAMPWIKHVHVADQAGRVAPGESGQADYRPLFRVLKQGGYDGMLSVEAMGFNDIATLGPRVLAFLKQQWAEA